MRTRNPGDRVGVFLSVKNGTLNLLGYGVYEGWEVPNAEEAATAGGVVQHLHNAGSTNPKISLDTGEVVWGCEAYFLSEDGLKNHINGSKVQTHIPEVDDVKEVSISDSRQRQRQNNKPAKFV